MSRHIVDFKRGCELAGLDLDAAVAIDHQTNTDQSSDDKTTGETQ